MSDTYVKAIEPYRTLSESSADDAASTIMETEVLEKLESSRQWNSFPERERRTVPVEGTDLR